MTQPELAPGTFPAPPPGLAAVASAKNYTYTCPDKGRAVQRC